MTRPLRILAADDDAAMRLFYERTLTRLGHQVHAVACGRQLAELCRAARPELAIVAAGPPDGDAGIEAAAAVSGTGPVPVILVSGSHVPGLSDRTGQDDILACLVKPITEAQLAVAVAVAWQRFEQLESLRKEAHGLRQALEDRKLVERAKGALMHRAWLDEPEAYRRMRRLASNRNLKLTDVARLILGAEEVFAPLEQAGHGGRPAWPGARGGGSPVPPVRQEGSLP